MKYTMTANEDKPFPYTTQIQDSDGNVYNPNDLDKLPKRIVEFFSLVKENSEVIRLTGVKNLTWLKNRLKKHGNEFGDVTEVTYRKNVISLEYEVPPPKVEDLKKLDCMANHFDGAHCGLGDWYPDIEKGLIAALKTKKNWTTGWYSSKKEIASARISHINGEIKVEVSVSDDFDTEGDGEKLIPFTRDLDTIRSAIYEAWDFANDNQKDNRMYAAWSVGECKNGKRVNWIETYLMDTHGLDSPPGDNYSNWGWQGENGSIPKKYRDMLEEGIRRYDKRVVAGKYVAELWD